MTSLFYLDWTRSAHDASLFSNRSIKREHELKFRSDKMEFHECIANYPWIPIKKFFASSAYGKKIILWMSLFINHDITRIDLFNGSKTTMHRLRSVKRVGACGVFIDSPMFGNLKNYLAIDSYERRVYMRELYKLPRDKGRGEIAWHNRPT